MIKYLEMIDLHTHSTASDGELTTSELISYAARIGIKVIAITDHDTTSGLEEAELESFRYGIHLIPGIEIDVEFNPGVLHLLGLGLNMDNISPLIDFLVVIRQWRMDRNREMKKLILLNYPNAENVDFKVNETTGRIHFARFLMETGLAKSIPEAFSFWLNKGGPYYVPKKRPTLNEALDVIHQVGGKAVIAHPKSLKVEWEHLPDLFSRWKDFGLDGIEAWHSDATLEEAETLSGIAHDCELYVTGGSDFHGSVRPDRLLGRGAGNQILRQEYFKPFLDSLKNESDILNGVVGKPINANFKNNPIY